MANRWPAVTWRQGTAVGLGVCVCLCVCVCVCLCSAAGRSVALCCVVKLIKYDGRHFPVSGTLVFLSLFTVNNVNLWK